MTTREREPDVFIRRQCPDTQAHEAHTWRAHTPGPLFIQAVCAGVSDG